MKLSTKPYIGTKDYIGQDLDILFYIFKAWRELALSYNYQEYITPLVESSILYKAKSGEEVGGKELYEFTDKGEREIAIRPEATPSITRLVAQFYNNTPKPIRVFSILNFMRYERPQRGRLREFWQFNIDMFGDDSLASDVEMLKIAIESLLTFSPPKNSFIVYVNSRPLMDKILNTHVGKDKTSTVQKIIDKYTKTDKGAFIEMLKTDAGLNNKQADKITNMLEADLKELVRFDPSLSDFKPYARIVEVLKILNSIGYSEFVKYNPAIVRGLDYYDGIVFEAFDLAKNNNRAMFGGGRYNGLGSLFGLKNMPAVGLGIGNVTVEIFLRNWNLLPEKFDSRVKVFMPQILKDSLPTYYKLSDWLREKLKAEYKKPISIEVSTQIITIKKALKYALAKNFDVIAIYAEDETKASQITIKDLGKRTQKYIKIPKLNYKSL